MFLPGLEGAPILLHGDCGPLSNLQLFLSEDVLQLLLLFCLYLPLLGTLLNTCLLFEGVLFPAAGNHCHGSFLAHIFILRHEDSVSLHEFFPLLAKPFDLFASHETAPSLLHKPCHDNLSH